MVNYEDVYIRPFASERYQRRKFCQKEGSDIALELIQVYFNKLFDGEYILKLPKEKRGAFIRNNDSSFMKRLETTKRALHEIVLEQSSFETHIIDLSGYMKVLRIERVKFTKWNERRRIKEISKADCISGNEGAKKLFSSLAGPVTSCIDFQYGNISAVYFTSRKVFHYLSFSQRHKEMIQDTFLKEHLKILESLMCIAKPIMDQEQRCQISYPMKQFIVGFSLGSRDGDATLMEDIDINFYIALYVLEKLLKMAEQKFHFMDVRWIN